MGSIKLKKGDVVKVISGKAAGPGGQGRIIKVLADENKVVVEGVNKAKRHQKPTRQDQKGGIIEKEMPIHISNVVLLKDNAPVKVRKAVQDGKRVRLDRKTGKAID